MRQRAVRARGDDRGEARRLGAETPHRELQLDRHVALAATDEPSFEDPAQRLVGELAGGTDARDLARFLDLALPLHRAGAGHELPALAQQLAEAPVRLDGNARVIEAKPSAVAGEQLRERLERIAADDLPRKGLGHLCGRLGDVAEVREEAVRAELAGELRPEQQRDRAAAGEAGEVAHIHQRLHQQCVRAELLELTRESLRARAGRLD